MSSTHAGPNTSTLNWASRALLIISGTLLFSAAIEVINPLSANGFPELEQRGPHGAYRLVNKPRPKLPKIQSVDEPEIQEPSSVQVKRRFPILVQQGPHGAYRIITKEGVGGPAGGEYKGYPKLERRGPHGAYHIVND